MIETRRPLKLAIFASVLTFAAVLIQNAATHDYSGNLTKITSETVPIGFGWPMIAIRGNIDAEQFVMSTFAPQFWRNTTDFRIVPMALLVNSLIAGLLSFTMYRVIQSLRLQLQLKLSIASTLGLCAFLAVDIYLRWLGWHEFAEYAARISTFDGQDVFDQHVKTELTAAFFRYSKNLVWISMLATCLWLPHIVVRRIELSDHVSEPKTLL